jgi:hypothetical protein
MSTKEKTLPKFAVGSQVRVKNGVTAPNSPDMPIGGWSGIVYQASGTIYLIHWDRVTLEAIDPSYRRQCELDGVDFCAVWLQERELEPNPGEPLYVEE